MADVVSGTVKWFDPKKGFGFVTPGSGGSDILLHANIVRNYGQSSVADGMKICVEVNTTPRGAQATRIVTLEVSGGVSAREPLHEEKLKLVENLEDVPFEPARVKWFDPEKGYGFANAFGQAEDVFIHAEVLKQGGFATLLAGEAFALKIVRSDRGLVAVAVASWQVADRGEAARSSSQVAAE
ncbi:MAG: cold shock domain-containing protein [Candidatus Pacebacteria bacterium]|jgi:CspA family cold shock protein|nr:cold shock domain-containing protein [Candidatus Paceibacterota bacterium]